MDDRRRYVPEEDPQNLIQGNNPSVPNLIPHVHHSSLGKRYCDHCGQRMIENEHTRPQGTYRGELQLPILRGRGNIENDRVSEGVVSATIQTTVIGTILSTGIARTRDLDIGQLPKGAIRAHMNVRSLACIAAPVGSVITPPTFSAFLYYQDVNGIFHVLGSLVSSGLASAAALSTPPTRLIVENPITDGAPQNLGAFAVELVAYALGTATRVDFLIRANMSTLYEVT